MKKEAEYWALKWRSKNRLDGKREYFIFYDDNPLLFRTQREARHYRDEVYGDTAGLKVPAVVKIRLIMEEVGRAARMVLGRIVEEREIDFLAFTQNRPSRDPERKRIAVLRMPSRTYCRRDPAAIPIGSWNPGRGF